MGTPRAHISAAREAIIASIRGNLAASRVFDPEHQKHHRELSLINDARPAPLSQSSIIENFRSALEFVGADCRTADGLDKAAQEVRSIIDAHAARKIALSDSPAVGSLLRDVTGLDVKVNCSPAELFDRDVGITSAQWGIAETGTLVLESDCESHRLTSLIPSVHVCILNANNIRQTLGEILVLVSGELSRTVTFITGASRTSDIELTLAIGVHGPKELHVIIISEG